MRKPRKVKPKKIMNKHSKNNLAILMGTYNGAFYIKEQIESIQKQTHTEWTLIIRDDGSSDDTLRIIRGFIEKDKRIYLLTDRKGNIGPAQNFLTLSDYALKSGFKYFMYADQDDVWRNDKTDISMSMLTKAEQKKGTACPLLFHTDMQVTDSALNIIHESHIQLRNVAPDNKKNMNTLLVQNFVTGCSMACNKALLNIAIPAPGDIIMHDWWFALCASMYGQILYSNEKTLLYRQHSKNQIGARKHNVIPNPFRRDIITLWLNGNAHFQKKLQQAIALKNTIGINISPIRDCEETLKNFLYIFETNNPIKKMIRTYKTHLRTQRGLIHDLLTLSYIVTTSKRSIRMNNTSRT